MESRNGKASGESLRRDRIRGSLIGGAAGDALGYAIEFDDEKSIFGKYGKSGITEYEYEPFSGKAIISDDTQMTLFTANGILAALTASRLNKKPVPVRRAVTAAYLDWLRTQEMAYSMSGKKEISRIKSKSTWLADVPELYSQRAPGNTCMSALHSIKEAGKAPRDFLQTRANKSKGCGAVMRLAPMGMIECGGPVEAIMEEGAQLGAITHGHSLGYIPGAVLAHIIYRIIFPEQEMTLKQIVLDARDTMQRVFKEDKNLPVMTELIDRAVFLSENKDSDLSNIHALGEGWVGDEALAIAIYCSLRHCDDFSAGLIASVNHEGDSDSTGAVTGNILGALFGFDAIEEKWKKNLELIDVILELADDISKGCPADKAAIEADADWYRKYVRMQWKSDDKTGRAGATKILAVMGDITDDQGVEAIANAANTSLLGGGGVDGAIHRAAGPDLLRECRTLNGCRTGQAKITKAYRLPCKYVIHTPGPIWYGGGSNERELLASCYRSCLQLAVDNGIRSIAFPSISTGIYCFPLEEAAEIAVKTAAQFVADHPDRLDVIKWVLFDRRTYEAYRSRIEK